MKDINFFIPYFDKKRVKFNNKLFLIILFTICIISMVSYGVFNQLRIKKLSEGLNKLEEIAENPEIVEEVRAIRIEEEQLNKLELEVESIRDLKQEVNKKDLINSAYIESIISKKPLDLFLTSIYIDSENMSITGISNNRISIAEFGKGLKTIVDLNDIFIKNITKEGISDYTFELERAKGQEEDDGTNEEEKETPERLEKE